MGRSCTRFGNNWCGEFSLPRKINDEQRLVEARKAQFADGDDLGIFFIDSKDTTAPLEVDVVENFCQGAKFEYIKDGKGSAGSQRTVWLDDRNCLPDLEGSGDAREYDNPLTATGLLRALELPRFNHEKLHDAARRLIYVSDLSPDCIHALAATASSLHARALRNAIYRHLVFRPSIAVKIPSTGCLAFQLELHLPFFILRKSTPPDKTHGTVKTKPDRGWTDLSFLELDTLNSNVLPSEPNEIWCLQEAQISCVITGTDDWRWTGYGFVDAEVDGLLAEAVKEEMCFDQIIGGEIEAKYPIWRPRDYWVRVFEVRIYRITRHYENLLYKLNFSFDGYMKVHPFTLSPGPDTSRNQTAEMKLAFDWALRMMGVLQKLRTVLLATIEAWRAFNSEDGDVGYFFDDINEDATEKAMEAQLKRHRSMQNIKKMFCELGEYQSHMVTLSEKCLDYKKALELNLTLSQKKSADKNDFISAFTITFLYPVALAASIFGMQNATIPFEQTPKSFGITIFIIMVMMFFTQFLGMHALPSLRKTLALTRKKNTWWIGRGEIAGAWSRASSQGRFLLSGHSLAQMSRYFNRPICRLQQPGDEESEKAQSSVQDLNSTSMCAVPPCPTIARDLEIGIPLLESFRNLSSKPVDIDKEIMQTSTWNTQSENCPSETNTDDTYDEYESSSDVSEDWRSSVEWQHHFILESIMIEFYALFNRVYGGGSSSISCPPSSGPSGSSGNGPLSSAHLQPLTSSSSSPQGSKRSTHDGRFPPPDDQDEGNKRPRILSVQVGDNQCIRRYACPFFKRNPVLHSHKGSCTGPGFRSISHLKEHLYRCHMAPVQCPRCWIEVGEGSGLEVHLNGDAQCQKREPQPAEGICHRKFKLLKSKKKLSAEPGDEARWADIFRILFPGIQPIPSPYYEHEVNTMPTSTQSDKLGDFRQYSQARLPGLIETHVERILEKELQPLEARIKSMVQDITRKCLSDLVRDWQTSDIGDICSYKIPSQGAEPAHEFAPQHIANVDQSSSWNEAPILDTRNQLTDFIESDSGRSFDHLNFFGSITEDARLSQHADWVCSPSVELMTNTEVPDRVEPGVTDFFCLEFPPHPEPLTYEGKGKGREVISPGSRIVLCTLCFSHNGD